MPPSPHADPVLAAPTSVERLDAPALRATPLPVDEHGDKHARGTVLVVAGSSLTAGAALLSGIAALRMGAGRLQIATDSSIAANLSIAVPEAMVLPLPDPDPTDDGTRDRLDTAVRRCDAMLVGPGLLGPDDVFALVERAMELLSPTAILVLDAAALGSIDRIEPSLLARLRGRLVVTPNRQELQALTADLDCELGTDDLAAIVSARVGAVVTSFDTVSAPDGRRWVAERATPGLGTSGSGDVLAGLVVGAAARCGDAALATRWATFVHGAAGNRLSERLSRTGFIARELLDEVPHVLADLE